MGGEEPMAEFNGQAALVTGAGRGIGKAIALRLAQGGADVAIADINREWAEATAAEIQIAGVVGAFGKIDILVNNAGTSKSAPFLEITKEGWLAQLNVHMSGTFYCSQAAARDMRTRG